MAHPPTASGLMSLADGAAQLVVWCGAAILLVGVIKLVSIPLAVTYELRDVHRRRSGRHSLADENPWVSVIVPAYNEAPVLANCIESLVSGSHRRVEVVIVDDGSIDETPEIAAGLARAHPQVRYVRQENAGKGAALNRGIAESTGEVLFFVDADGIFAPDTIGEMLRGFDSPRVGAVCGDDRPVNLDRVQTRLMAIVSHAGTGLVRRALSLVGCLHIVSGNVGAFTREVIEVLGGFDESTVGEDLELTWRVRRAGYRIVFRPRAIVYAESPSTLRNLWRQRLRWARGLLQTMRLQRDMIGSTRYGLFGGYLAVNALTMVVLPPLQLVVLALLPLVALTGTVPVDGSVWGWLGFLGVAVSAAVIAISLALNKAWLDARHVWTLPLWPLYATLLAAVMVVALWQEARRSAAPWNKMVRTGVVSVDVAQRASSVTMPSTATGPRPPRHRVRRPWFPVSAGPVDGHTGSERHAGTGALPRGEGALRSL
ncbi:glycosyltransferase [Cellulosimicrobium cellulans]|uniref:glycosyltransferase n=1 Tax=Cellulosimicrobium cellulans TaxID=1710 RepID=UPI002407051C|nr:glycosyltransferase family 2 protein [Cellulosimicrobium cellulans]MDF9875176.1 biofilm PGA synthesis N-glycosyltransferase PgaC [Cellulosimicrobium cellulans]